MNPHSGDLCHRNIKAYLCSVFSIFFSFLSLFATGQVNTRILCLNMVWKIITTLAVLALTILVISPSISEANRKRKHSPHCKTRAGITTIRHHGCHAKRIISHGCFGRCLSSARPLLNDKGRFATSCSCCAPIEYYRRQVVLNCNNGIKKAVLTLVATNCMCRPC